MDGIPSVTFHRPLVARVLTRLGLRPSLRVFLSSTSEFAAERRQIERDLRWLVGFILYERIPASGKHSLDDQLTIWIDDSDLVLGVYGLRRGHVPLDSSKSVTESEYDKTVAAPRDLIIHMRKGAVVDTDDDSQRTFLQHLMDPTLHRITEFSDSGELRVNSRATIEQWILETFELGMLQVPYAHTDRLSSFRWALACLVIGMVVILIVVLTVNLWPLRFVGLI